MFECRDDVTIQIHDDEVGTRITNQDGQSVP